MRAAVIGVGRMGRQHARVYTRLPGVELVAVADGDENTGRAVAKEFGASYFPDYRDLLSAAAPDIISVAVPTKWHLTAGREALAAGRAVLIEKPIALNPDEGRELIECARRQGKILTVGHIERFNPAVRLTKTTFESGVIGQPLKMLFRREGPDPERIRDTNVILDIGIHDIDLACWFTGKKPTRIHAEGGSWRRQDLEDYASLHLAFAGDNSRPTLANIELSWINRAKVRKIDIVGSAGYLSADLLRQRVAVFTADLAPVYQDIADFREYQELFQAQSFRSLDVPETEPLFTELSEFVRAARGEAAELVSPEEAVTALTIALHVTHQIKINNCRF